MTRKWNAEDDKILFELYDKLSLEELSKRLDRSKNAIKRRYKELKAKDTKSRVSENIIGSLNKIKNIKSPWFFFILPLLFLGGTGNVHIYMTDPYNQTELADLSYKQFKLDIGKEKMDEIQIESSPYYMKLYYFVYDKSSIILDYLKKKKLENTYNSTNIDYEKSLALMSLSKYEDALIYIDKALSRDKDNMTFLLTKARILASLERYEESLRYFNRVLVIEPENKEVLLDKSTVYMAMGHYDEALILLEIARRQKVDVFGFAEDMKNELREMSKEEGMNISTEDIEMSITIVRDVYDPYVDLNTAIVYEEIGEYERAMLEYNKLLVDVFSKTDENSSLYKFAKNRREGLLFKMFPPPPQIEDNLIYFSNSIALNDNSLLYYGGSYGGPSHNGDEASVIFICKNNNKRVKQVRYIETDSKSDKWGEKYIFYCDGLDKYWIYLAGGPDISTRLYGPFENLTLKAK
ncbi:MAG: hypothetical protein KAR87_01265 [Candidatus Aenigmarchaeota archaeon]|nr:hypothetical protein [Candidatus Aenigmarchaeota archaeon]